MDELDVMTRALSETLHTGSPPGKPPAQPIVTWHKGKITAVATDRCTVEFPTDPDDPDPDVMNLRFLVTGRTLVVGDHVLVAQFPDDRLIFAAISH